MLTHLTKNDKIRRIYMIGSIKEYFLICLVKTVRSEQIRVAKNFFRDALAFEQIRVVKKIFPEQKRAVRKPHFDAIVTFLIFYAPKFE